MIKELEGTCSLSGNGGACSNVRSVGCCGVDADKQKLRQFVLSFDRCELLYDVRNYAFVQGDILGEDMEHVRHQVQDIGEEGNIDRVDRVLSLSHAECVEMLYPYAKAEIPEELDSLNDVLSKPRSYEIRLSLPMDFSISTLRLLEHLIHEYMVSCVLSDWFGLTLPQLSERWYIKTSGLKDQIKSAISSRGRRVRRTLTPW